jgi:zinc protease
MQFILSLFIAQVAFSYIGDDVIGRLEKETHSFKLKSGIPVIYRKIEGPSLTHIRVGFALSSIQAANRNAPDLMGAMVSKGAGRFSKEDISRRLEKFSIVAGCTSGFRSVCFYDSANEFWKEGLGIFAAMIANPTFPSKEFEVEKRRYIAGLKSSIADPSFMANEAVNQIFYGDAHPFYTPVEEMVKGAEKLSVADMRAWHKLMYNKDLMTIVVITSLSQEEVTKELEVMFAKVPQRPVVKIEVADPVFDPKKGFNLIARENPTAFINIKFNGYSRDDKRLDVTNLALDILRQDLWDELRTRLSLTYGAGVGMLSLEIGVGRITVTTSKPKETMTALNKILRQFPKKKWDSKRLQEYKMKFFTEYYLDQETHSSLAGSLLASQMDHGSTSYFYRFPKRLEAISTKQIQAVMADLLKDYRVGVVFNEKGFDAKWAEALNQKKK